MFLNPENDRDTVLIFPAGSALRREQLCHPREQTLILLPVTHMFLRLLRADRHIMAAHIRKCLVLNHCSDKVGGLLEHSTKPGYLLKADEAVLQVPEERAQVCVGHRINSTTFAVADIVEALTDQNHQFPANLLGLTPQDKVGVVLQYHFIGHSGLSLGTVQVNNIIFQRNCGCVDSSFRHNCNLLFVFLICVTTL